MSVHQYHLFVDGVLVRVAPQKRKETKNESKITIINNDSFQVQDGVFAGKEDIIIENTNNNNNNNNNEKELVQCIDNIIQTYKASKSYKYVY